MDDNTQENFSTPQRGENGTPKKQVKGSFSTPETEGSGKRSKKDNKTVEDQTAGVALTEVNDELERQNRLYETIISSTPDLVYVFDRDYRFTFVNDALLDMWGMTLEESLGKTLLEVGYERWHAEMHEREIDQVIETQQPVRGEVPFNHARLGERIYDYIFVPVFNEQGDVEAVAGTTRDITDYRRQVERRARMEEALRRSEQKYRKLFESLDEGFCIIDMVFDEGGNAVDYIFKEVNPAFEKQTGLKEVEGKKISDFDPDHQDYWFEVYGNVALTGESKRFKNVAMGRLYDVYAFPIGEGEGPEDGPYKVAAIFTDITDRRRAEEEREELLREVETERERLAEVFQHAPSFMCILRGPEYVFERANDLYYELIGDRDIIGKPAAEAIPESTEQGFIDMLDQVYQTGEPISATDQRLVLEQGEGQSKERFIDFVYQPFRDSQGEVTGIFVQGVDLTKRKQAQKELQEMNETLEERVEERTSSLLSYQEQLRSLASRLSKAEEKERHRLATELHDNLGQMLAVNKMKVDLLSNEQLPEEVIASIEEIKEGMDEALVYTRGLMSDLKPPPSLDKEDIRATIEWLAQKMQKHDLKVVIDDDGLQKHSTEEIRTTILQCVRELLFNIVKHTDEDEAFIRMRRSDGQVQVVVEDKGEGFDPSAEHSTPTEDGGFGLFNIKERMDLLGGSMNIDSAPGKGTKIVLTAPVKEVVENDVPAHSGAIKRQDPSKRQPQRKIKVLLADDHQMIREGLKKIVDSEDDLQVIGEAADGEEAVELALETSPDIVVMDVNMPRMNGIDATQKIVEQLPDTRVVGLSLHDHQEVITSMRNAGASAYLTKNEAFETLCATIRSEAKLAKEEL